MARGAGAAGRGGAILLAACAAACTPAASAPRAEDEGATKPAPPPGSLLWTATIGEVDRLYVGRRIFALDDGSVLSLSREALESTREGARAWNLPVAHAGWAVPLPGARALIRSRTPRGASVVELRTGTIVRTFAGPTRGDGEPTDAWGAVPLGGSRALVAFSDGSLIELDVDACASARPGCQVTRAKVDPRWVDPLALSRGADGTLYATQPDTLRALSPDGAARFALFTRLGGAVASPSADGAVLAVALDEELVLLDARACSTARGRIALPWKPGLLHGKDVGVCDDCVAAPPGCAAHAQLRPGLEVPSVRATWTRGGVAMNVEEQTIGVRRDGSLAWQQPTGGIGEVAADGDGALYTVAVDRDDEHLYVVAMTEDGGATRWRTRLPITFERSASYATTDLAIAVDRRRVLAAFGDRLVAVAR